MDYEKAYKDALSRAKDFMNDKVHYALRKGENIMCWIFPELRESEDERIRKELLEHCINRRDGKQVCVDASDYRRWADWLEKQGDYNQLVEEMKERKELISKEKEKATSSNDKLSLGGRIAILEELLAFTKEKQGEQKPANIEPKFHKGDMIIHKELGGDYIHNPHKIIQVDILDKEYRLEGGLVAHFSEEDDYELVEQNPADKVEPKSDIEKGKWYVCHTPRYTDFVVGKAYYCPKNGMLKPNENEMARYVAKGCFHLWTIQDAKDGDVLVYEGEIFMIKSYVLWNKIVYHCCYDGKNLYKDSVYYSWGRENFDKVHPATKEQRAYLFAKMFEAGYEWDSNKKELRKIDDYCKENCKGFQETGKCYVDGECKAKKDAEQKLAWSEEDEDKLDLTIFLLKEFREVFQKDAESCITWLKSLKPQPHWKPTEEQIHCFKCVIDFYKTKVNDTIVLNLLNSLYNNLLKL